MISEDHGEVLREGEYGDLRVKIEDTLIGLTLERYSGPQRDGVLRLFYFFAVFPEDAPIPGAFLEVFGTSLLRASGKRPQLQVRTWLQELRTMSLLQGDFEAGFMFAD